MAKYYLTKKAVEDLSEIWDYTYEEWSEKQADKYYNFLLAAFQELANNPHFGRQYDSIRKELLGYKSNHHIIFFRKNSDSEIEITRILHERMDLRSKL